jgi:2-amino-4-hydroxy-6-hydroxymethyldihydropteridine diphosphokinase
MSLSKPAANGPSAWIALGSNLGDRAGNLRAALGRLRAEAEARLLAVSSLYATDPVGLPGAPEFLNAVAEIRSPLGPEALLAACLRTEAALGRVRTGAAGSRPIDLDLLLYGQERRTGGALILPHPRMTVRAFVLQPLAEIAPDLLVEGERAAARARRLGSAGVRRCADVPGWPPT